MNKLVSQLYVLRCIAFFRPHAHLAFLFHAPYRAMYDNQGQNVELCEFYGQWIYRPGSFYEMEKVFHILPHNQTFYHPMYCAIAIYLGHGFSKKYHICFIRERCNCKYDTIKLSIDCFCEYNHNIERIYKSEELEEFNLVFQTMQKYKARARTIK